MPLETQILDVPLSAGLNQKSDVRGLEQRGAVVMQNCVALKNGAIRKRFGTTALSNSGVGASLVMAGGAYKNAMWMSDLNSIWQWSDANAKWTPQCNCPSVAALDRVTLAAFTQNVVDYDAVYVNGYVVAVFSTQNPAGGNLNTLWYTVVDASSFGSLTGIGGLEQGISGAAAAAIQPLTTGFQQGLAPKLAACGSFAVLTYIDPGSTNLVAVNLNTAAISSGWSAPVMLVAAVNLSTLAKTGVYDISAVAGDASRFMVAVGGSAGATGLLLLICATNPISVSSTNTVDSGVNDFSSMALQANNNAQCWIGYTQLVAGAYRVGSAAWNDNAHSATATRTVTTEGASVPIGKIDILGIDATHFGIVWSTSYAIGATAMNSAFVKYAYCTTAASSGSFKLTPNVQLASRTFMFGSTGYFAVSLPSSLQGTTYLCAADYFGIASSSPSEPAARPVCTLAPRLQKNVPQPMVASGSYSLPHIFNIPTIADANGVSEVWGFALPFSTQTFHAAIGLQMVDICSPVAKQNAALGDHVSFAMGVPSLYDGQNVGEVAFCNYPELATPTMAGSGGNLSAGVYQWIARYEWYDSNGQVHRSAASVAVSATAVNLDKATVVVPVPSLTMRQVDVQSSTVLEPYVVLYRTTANGTIFYRQTSDPPPLANQRVGGVNTISIVDSTSDATLTASATAQLEPATGGTLDNFNPPSSRCVVQHQQRLFFGGCDNPKQVWPTRNLTDGEGPGCNESIAFLATGAVRAMQSMDDKLILFVQRGASYGIEYVTGAGPNDTGTQGFWDPPQPIPSDVGAIDQRGTCVTPMGILFRAPVGGPNGTGGIYLLTRDLQVKYVSGPVEDLLAAAPIVTSMVVHPNNGRVYITLLTSDQAPTLSGLPSRLVWDYTNGGTWSNDVLWDTDRSASGLACRAAWIADAAGVANAPQGPTYHCSSADYNGRVYRESYGVGAGAYMDAGSTWVTMKYQSAWLKASAAGFQRFWRTMLQADSLETHDFTMTLTFDYAAASYYNEAHTWTATQIAAFDRAPQVDVVMTPLNQKAKAIQVTLTDATPTGGGASTGQGPSWATISLELGVDKGLYKNLPPAQRA